MAEYTLPTSDKSRLLKKDKELQNPFQINTSAQNPFTSANQNNPFGGKTNTNPFVTTAKTSQNTIQRNASLTSLSGTSALEDQHTSSIKNKKSDGFDVGSSTNDTTTSIHSKFADATDSAGEAVYANPNGVKGTIGIASGLFTMAKGIKELMDPETDGFDKAMAGIDVATGAGGIAQTITDLAQGEGGKAAPIIGVVNSGLGAIKNAIVVVKQIKKLKDGVEEGTKAKEALALAGQITQVGLDIANIVKSIYSIVGTAAPGALEAAIPGLGIVMATIDIIQQGVEIAKAVQNFKAMSTLKDDLKTNVKADYTDVFTSDKSGMFGKFRSDDRTVEPNLEKAIKQEIGGTANGGAAANGKESAREFALARELKKVNRKRIIRGAINVSADALTIAGDIATLSGIGASAGVGLKVGAAGLKGGVTLARLAKQKYRDSGYGDSSKTSNAKHEKRVDNIKFIFHMIKGLTPTDNDKADRIKAYIEASGTSFNSFIKYKTNPKAAAKLLYSAMKKREASDEVSAE